MLQPSDLEVIANQADTSVEPETQNGCLMCLQQATTLLFAVSESENIISEALIKHFWFTEADLQQATICQNCWEQVSSFHQFYLSVEERYRELDGKIEDDLLEDHELVVLADDVDVDTEPDEEILPTNEVDMLPFENEDDDNCSATNTQDDPIEAHLVKRVPQQKKSQLDTLAYRGKRLVKSERDRQLEDDYIREHVKYICELCGQDSSSFNMFLKHSQEEHGKKSAFIACCGKKYYKKVRLYEHVQTVNNPDTFRCQECCKNFTDNEGLKRHVKEFHATEEERKYKCDRCPKSFVIEYKYKLHMKDHEDWDNQNCKCEHCGKIYKSHHILSNHIKLKHTAPTDFICDICAKGFHLKSRFLQHKLEHENPAELKVQCQVCLRWLKNRESWRRHARQHQETQVTCDICGHISPHSRALKGHKRRQHSEQKPEFACSYCSKTFHKPITLKEHVAAVHTGDVLYSCPFCEKTFNSHANMHSHKKKMHPSEWLEQYKSKYYSR